MRGLRWGAAMLLVLGVVAVSSTSWAEKKFKTKEYEPGCYDRYHQGDKDPPGWDKGKKTGWGDSDLPPGQAKKYNKRYKRGYDPYHDRRPDEQRTGPEYIPVPVPVPTR